jgi:hypothetical protein
VWRTTHACALARLAWPGRGRVGRRARAHDLQVNGPPKSGPSPCGARLPFAILFFGYLAVKFRALTDRDKDLSCYRNVSLSVRG